MLHLIFTITVLVAAPEYFLLETIRILYKLKYDSLTNEPNVES